MSKNPIVWLVFFAFLAAGVWLRNHWSVGAALVIGGMFVIVVGMNYVSHRLGELADYHERSDAEQLKAAAANAMREYAKQAQRREGRA